MKQFKISAYTFLWFTAGLFLLNTTALWSQTPQTSCWQIARIKYNGGGDWYADPTSLPNLLQRVKKDLHADVCEQEANIALMEGTLYNYPILYLTGHGNIAFSEQERNVLREYLLNGGLLIADDNYGMDSSFRAEVQKLFPKIPLAPLPKSHPVFSSHYRLKQGLPKIHQHDGKPPQAYGIRIEDKHVIFYSYESDLGDGWESADVHNVPQHKRESAFKMGVNLFAWYLMGHPAHHE